MYIYMYIYICLYIYIHIYELFMNVSYDFKSAFGKAPHRSILETLADVAIKSMPLCWFDIYLTDRTEQVHVGTYLSVTSSVILGVVQVLV